MVIEKTEQERKIIREDDRVVRILSRDIEGKMRIYPGLTKIKGISWSVANAICINSGFDRKRKIGSLSEAEVKKLEAFIKNPELPSFMVNRKFDIETGEDKHLVGTELELRKEFDIKRLKKIKSFRGIRHVAGLPLRGQRTKANFRKNRKKSVGINKKK